MYLMHLGTQFTLVLLLFVFGGYYLDRLFQVSWFLFTFVFAFLGFCSALYILVKEVSRHDKVNRSLDSMD